MSIVAGPTVTSAWRGSQRPGLLHLPDGSDAHVGDALELLGEWEFDYDEAQEFVIASTLRERADGRWAAKEIGVEEPRQNGKGELAEGRECLGMFYLGERKLIHSAHEFATASEALDRMEDRIARNPPLKRRVKTVKRSHGEEGIYLKDGRKLLYKTRTAGSGRGFSGDFLLLDEAMFIAERFLASLMPIISARPNPQMWYMGSAVDQLTMPNGIVFARLRRRALQHRPGRMAYFGWSAAYLDGKVIYEDPSQVPAADAANPRVIARANPALGPREQGGRIELEHIIDTELEAMDHRTFCVERLGVGDWPRTDGVAGSVLEPATWQALEDPLSAPTGPICLALDVTPNRSHAAIGVGGIRADGLRHAELVEHGKGTGWAPARAAELVRVHGATALLVDLASPAASLIPELMNLGLEIRSKETPAGKLVTINSAQHAQACGMLFDLCDQAMLRHLGGPELEAAVKGATRRPLGERWAWSRKESSVDISPLVAITLALWGSATIQGTDLWMSFT